MIWITFIKINLINFSHQDYNIGKRIMACETNRLRDSQLNIRINTTLPLAKRDPNVGREWSILLLTYNKKNNSFFEFIKILFYFFYFLSIKN